MTEILISENSIKIFSDISNGDLFVKGNEVFIKLDEFLYKGCACNSLCLNDHEICRVDEDCIIKPVKIMTVEI